MCLVLGSTHLLVVAVKTAKMYTPETGFEFHHHEANYFGVRFSQLPDGLSRHLGPY